jgi:hypothetical protein
MRVALESGSMTRSLGPESLRVKTWSSDDNRSPFAAIQRLQVPHTRDPVWRGSQQISPTQRGAEHGRQMLLGA